MPHEALETLLEEGRGGLWFLSGGASAKAVQAAANGAGFPYFHIEGRSILRKEQLLNAFSTALRFPKHFGHNWDALEESLAEFEAGSDEGFVILYEHIDGLMETHPDQMQTLVEICRDAVASWKAEGTTMVVLFSGAKAPKGVAKLKSGP